MFCSDTAAGGKGTKIALIFVGPFAVPPDIAEDVHMGWVMNEFEEEVGFDKVVPGYRAFMTFGQSFKGCKTFPTQSAASSAMASRQSAARRNYGIIRTVDWRPSFEKLFEAKKAKAESTKAVASSDAKKGKEAAAVPAPAPEKPTKTKAQYEAEWQAKVAAHEAAVADYQRKLAEREAEIARQRKLHAAAVDAAAREQAAHKEKMEAHRLELAEANRRQQAYFEAQRQHALCVNGDRAACDALKQPQSGKDEQASTDTDATMCVAGPVVAATPGMKGSLSATVINGCPTAVDVRICLAREGGWNCGVTWGLKPQARWSHSSFKSSGDIFWDARTSGSTKPLASPAGS